MKYHKPMVLGNVVVHKGGGFTVTGPFDFNYTLPLYSKESLEASFKTFKKLGIRYAR